MYVSRIRSCVCLPIECSLENTCIRIKINLNRTHTGIDSFCFLNKQARKQNLNKSTFTGKYKEVIVDDAFITLQRISKF